jgi:hypothetical protein
VTREELIEALERGETGREIDADVFRVFGYTVKVLEGPGHLMQGRFLAYPPEGPQRCEPARLAVSTSLDAAVALCERVRPGTRWLMDSLGHVKLQPPESAVYYSEAPTPSAALLAALLKATDALRAEGE